MITVKKADAGNDPSTVEKAVSGNGPSVKAGKLNYLSIYFMLICS